MNTFYPTGKVKDGIAVFIKKSLHFIRDISYAFTQFQLHRIKRRELDLRFRKLPGYSIHGHPRPSLTRGCFT